MKHKGGKEMSAKKQVADFELLQIILKIQKIATVNRNPEFNGPALALIEDITTEVVEKNRLKKRIFE